MRTSLSWPPSTPNAPPEGTAGISDGSVEDAAFSYNPGDMTIVQTQFGWHLIYVYGQR